MLLEWTTFSPKIAQNWKSNIMRCYQTELVISFLCSRFFFSWFRPNRSSCYSHRYKRMLVLASRANIIDESGMSRRDEGILNCMTFVAHRIRFKCCKLTRKRKPIKYASVERRAAAPTRDDDLLLKFCSPFSIEFCHNIFLYLREWMNSLICSVTATLAFHLTLKKGDRSKALHRIFNLWVYLFRLHQFG